MGLNVLISVYIWQGTYGKDITSGSLVHVMFLISHKEYILTNVVSHMVIIGFHVVLTTGMGAMRALLR